MTKRILSAALALALALSLAVPACAWEIRFGDVPLDHWAAEAIGRASEDGVIVGTNTWTEDGRVCFEPDSPLTAAQFAAIVTQAFYWRPLRETERERSHGDAEPLPYWYSLYQQIAEQAGLMEGVGVEDWEVPMTRYQMAQMLYNIAADKKLEPPAASIAIADLDQVPEQYKEAVKSAYAMGFLSGMDDKGTFAGEQTLTRAQAAVVFAKLDKAMEAKDGPMERALEKAERNAKKYSFLSTTFTRYPGPKGTAYVISQGGLPHGPSTRMDYVYQDGSELSIDGLLPPGYRLSGIGGYFSPTKIRFDESGDKLSFVTPIEEAIPSKPGDGNPGIWAGYKDWGPTLCTVDLTSGTMGSMEPVRYSEYWQTEVEQDASAPNTSDCLTVTLTQESGKEDMVIQERNIPFAGMKVVLGYLGVTVIMPESLLADPDFQASEFGQVVQLLGDMNLPEYPGLFDMDHSKEEIKALREQTAQYVQVMMNGVPFPGDVWLGSPDEGTQALHFWLSDSITDRNLRYLNFLDGDTLTVRIGLPQA